MKLLKSLVGSALLLGCLGLIHRGPSASGGYFYEKPNIVSRQVSGDYDTGYFYQSAPIPGKSVVQNDYISSVGDRGKDSKISALQSRPPDPFEGDIFVSNKDFLTTYYSHLHDNMPMNILGICGYTATSMFLSFYDSYWNDDFIPEQYGSGYAKLRTDQFYSSRTSEYESPGVWNNIDSSYPSVDDLKDEIIESGITDQNSTAFKEALDRKVMEQVYEQIDARTFLGKLFEIAIDNGSIQPHFYEGEYHSVANPGYVDGIGVNYKIMNSVLSDHIDQNESLAGNVSIVTSQIAEKTDAESRRIRSEIVEIVKTGRPVLMGGNGYTDSNGNGVQDGNETSFGHVVVAYDYDEKNDILYGNMGWSSSSQAHRNLDEYFNIRFSDYWALNITHLRRKTINNYIFTDKHAFYSPGGNSHLYNVVHPVDYGFPEAYGNGTDVSTKTVTLKDTGETFETERLRCGYIEEECINISTRRYSPGKAYLECTFDKDIYSIQVDLSWWSDNESVRQGNSEYRIEYLDSDSTYEKAFDLWRDVTLPKDRKNPKTVTVLFPFGVHTFRFYGSTINYAADRNKGRLSIFDMVVTYYFNPADEFSL